MLPRVDARSVAIAAALVVLLAGLLVLRTAQVIVETHSDRRAPPRRQKSDEATLAVFLGSGELGRELNKVDETLAYPATCSQAATRPR